MSRKLNLPHRMTERLGQTLFARGWNACVDKVHAINMEPPEPVPQIGTLWYVTLGGAYKAHKVRIMVKTKSTVTLRFEDDTGNDTMRVAADKVTFLEQLTEQP